MTTTAHFAPAASRSRPAPEFEISGGALCLDFANTRVTRKNQNGGGVLRNVELLLSYRDVLTWGVQAGALSGADRARLQAQTQRNAAAVRAVLGRVREMREAIYEVFSAVAAHRAPTRESFSRLNRALAGPLAQSRLACTRQDFQWEFAGERTALDAVLWPVAQSAASLLTSDVRGRVRECEAGEAGTCAWLFLDRSRNRTRRWCDMKICGNRAKIRRFRQKQAG
jgi:predicted RNA-binding Zn ribbon-like protein